MIHKPLMLATAFLVSSATALSQPGFSPTTEANRPGPAHRQSPEEPPPPNAEMLRLALRLAETGKENGNVLALISAASLLAEHGLPVLPAESDDPDHSHQSEDSYSPTTLIAEARRFVDAQTSADEQHPAQLLLNAADDFVQRSSEADSMGGGYGLGWHTHWWCDAWGNCRWWSHFH